MPKKTDIQLLLEFFRSIKIPMVRELIHKNDLSFKRKKKMQASIFFQLVCWWLRSSAFAFKVWIYFYVKYWSLFKWSEINFFFLCWLRNTCKPIRVDLHWVPRSLECLNVILVKKLSLSQVSWRDTVASTQVTPEIIFILRGLLMNIWVLCLEPLLMFSVNCISANCI